MSAPDMMEWVRMLEGLKPRVSLPRSCTTERSLEWTIEEEMVLRMTLIRIVLTVGSWFVHG